MMRDLYTALPDDRPITAICVVEDVHKCPSGFTPIGRTHDQDLDADLWKDGFFGRRMARYLCLSKTEGKSSYVIDSLAIINEKEPPPNGYTVLSHTHSGDQKAWRKRQLCYRLSDKSSTLLAVSDIIILSRAKKAPEGFTLAGIQANVAHIMSLPENRPERIHGQWKSMEMNGLLICYKSTPVPAIMNKTQDLLQYNITPTSSPFSSHSESTNGVRTTPLRPAPLPPPLAQPTANKSSSHTATIGTLSGHIQLDGVPFLASASILSGEKGPLLPNVRIKTFQDLEAEYYYPFSVEREALQRF